MDEMTWYEDVACLLTRSMTAPLIESLDLDHYTGVAKGHAVIADDLSSGQFTDLLAQHTITALLLRSGSLIDHTAGIANARLPRRCENRVWRRRCSRGRLKW